MRITYRLVTAICLAVLVVVGGFAFLQIREERARLIRDLERRAALLAEGLKEAVGPVMGGRSNAPIERILKRFGRPNQVLVVYDTLASPIAVMPESASSQIPSVPEVTEALSTDSARKGFHQMEARRVYVYATPLARNERPAGALAVAATSCGSGRWWMSMETLRVCTASAARWPRAATRCSCS